jgi:hypothetical protein
LENLIGGMRLAISDNPLQDRNPPFGGTSWWMMLPSVFHSQPSRFCLQGNALRCFQHGSPFPTSYSKPVQTKVLHGVKQNDPIPMPEIRFALLELLQNYPVSIDNWLANSTDIL